MVKSTAILNSICKSTYNSVYCLYAVRVHTWIYSGQVTEPDWGVVSSTTTALVILWLINPTLFSDQMLMMLGFPLKKKKIHKENQHTP